MSESKRDSTPWVGPDDAPDLSEVDLKDFTWTVGGQPVPAEEGMAAMRKGLARGRPKSDVHKQPVTLRLDPDVLARWRASGKGWQTRAAALLAAGSPPPV